MTTRQKLEDKGINLNTILIVLSIVGASITIGKFAGPIFSGPERTANIEHKMAEVRSDVNKIQTAQTIQAEALKMLTTLAAESGSTRQATDRLTFELAEIRRRLDRVENR